MKVNRKGEIGQPPPRSSRIFNMECHWYFSTREGTDVGPFDSREEANSGLVDFIQFIQLAKQQTLHNFLKYLATSSRHRLTA